MGLGPAAGRTAVSLSQARVKAQELHAAVREGRRHDLRSGGHVLASHEAGWRSSRHRRQWRNSLRD